MAPGGAFLMPQTMEEHMAEAAVQELQAEEGAPEEQSPETLPVPSVEEGLAAVQS